MEHNACLKSLRKGGIQLSKNFKPYGIFSMKMFLRVSIMENSRLLLSFCFAPDINGI